MGAEALIRVTRERDEWREKAVLAKIAAEKNRKRAEEAERRGIQVWRYAEKVMQDWLESDFGWGDAESRETETLRTLESAEAELVRLREALQLIHDTQGKVCGEYEICRHRACRSSYESWAITDVVLLGRSLSEVFPRALAGEGEQT